MNSIKLKNKSILSLQALLIATTLYMASFTFTIKQENDNPFFTLPFTKTGERSHIDFVEDAHGKEFILKYSNSAKRSINDALGAKVGESVGININQVKILPPQDPSISSIDRMPDQIKTLHTLVPGSSIDKASALDLLHGLKGTSNLKSLMENKELCKIVALDIYLDNCDRHKGNYFYDKLTDQYYAIDMDFIFFHTKRQMEMEKRHEEPYYPYSNLSTTAYSFINNLNVQNLSTKEQKALVRVNKMLRKLISVYPPEKLCNDRIELAKEAHYTYSESDQKKFQAIVEYNFAKVKQLQNLLDQFFYTKQPKSISTKILKSIINPSNLAEQNFWQTINS
jgi:hypothetical protein